MDALIAAQWVLGLTEPQSSGLGYGGGFLLTHDGKRTLQSWDGRETAPAAARRALYRRRRQAAALQPGSGQRQGSGRARP